MEDDLRTDEGLARAAKSGDIEAFDILVRRSLAESGLVGLLGAAGGVLLAFWGVGVLRRVLPVEYSRFTSIEVDLYALGFAAALAVGATLLFGALPAFRSLTPNLIDLHKPSRAFGSIGGGGQRLREGMVVLQIALAIVLLVGAGLLVRSLDRLSRVDPGFRPEGLVAATVQLPSSRYTRSEWAPFFETVIERIADLPDVTAVGAVSDLPMSGVGLGFELQFTIEGLDALSPTARPNADVRLVVPGYFDAMDMSIVQGRDFDQLDRSAERTVVIVNQTLVDRYFRDIDPIGRTLELQMLGEVEIVGVVVDVRHNGLQNESESEIHIPYGRIATGGMQIVVQTELEPAAVASAVDAIVADLDPLLPVSKVVAMPDLLWESMARPRFNAALIAGLAVSAVLLAMIGTYGVVAYSVSQRTGEIGVRMALGADARSTMTMIVGRALGIVALGTGLGVLAALGSSRLIQKLLFEVPANDAATYAAVETMALVTGALAAWTPARRATRIDPVVALRNE